MAKVVNSFHSDRATAGFGSRYDVPAYGAAVGLTLEERYPVVRTDWADHLEGGATWLESHTMSDTRGVQQVSGGIVNYAAGKRYTTSWFSPVRHPAVGSAYAAPTVTTTTSPCPSPRTPTAAPSTGPACWTPAPARRRSTRATPSSRSPRTARPAEVPVAHVP
ncbi:hypothetical protein [Streptomyces zaomyceticus]|uniref:hypothetical protein n=1 Tax=Streptomyces zaomyceticus TaxID=68286 RepID=UPI00167BC4F9|nr:hypothetical protein [Streptomyces zaomyceticus]GHG11918.1 hypothetical protein GCM10018791_26740 [Streptomyces zaomyceticus]